MLKFEDIHYVNIDKSNELVNYFTNKISKLEKYIKNEDIHIVKSTLSKENNEFILNVNIIGQKNKIYKAESINKDAYASIDLIEEKLERQFRTTKNKREA